MTVQTRSMSRWQRLGARPAVRLVVELFLFLAALVIAQIFVSVLPTEQNFLVKLLAVLVVVILTLAAYAGIVRLVEQRRATEAELSPAGAPQELAAGAGTGAALFSAVIAILWALGVYRVAGLNSWTALLFALPGAVSSGVVEELLFRGMLFRLTEGWLGSWAALLVSALLFGLMHLAGPSASLWAAAAVAIEAGLLLGAAYLLTRRLWLAIGIHFAWDWVQTGVFGISSSGSPVTGFFNGALSGPALLSGGDYGAEASVIAVIACVLVSVFLLRLAIQKKHLLPRSSPKL